MVARVLRCAVRACLYVADRPPYSLDRTFFRNMGVLNEPLRGCLNKKLLKELAACLLFLLTLGPRDCHSCRANVAGGTVFCCLARS